MEVQRIDEGLWRWATRYGEWGHDVGSVYLEGDDAVVLIDPLVPEEPEDEERFWVALDRDVARRATPVHVLVTIFWHARSAQRLVDRYGATVHAVSGGRAAIARRVGVDPSVYRAGATLPAGVVALPTARRSEVVFWLPSHRALVPGDALLGDDDGRIRICPDSWLPESVDQEAMRASLAPLLDLPVERVLVSHGTPVLEDGHAALARLLRGA
jgi:glyoxylase-like metal-dependent hydrolase (beta-lactamase superfamily II)